MTEIQEILHKEKMKEWQERVFQCRNSGLSINEWCRRNNINRKTYFYWQRQVWDNKKKELKQIETAENEIRGIRFAEVSIEGKEQNRNENKIEIEHNGWTIRVENSIPLELLMKIMEMAV